MSRHKFPITPSVGALLLAIGLLMLLFSSTTLVFDGNLNLGPTSRARGDIVVLSGNLNLQAGAEVDGSLLMLCCNLMANGAVAGDLALLTGNLNLGPQAHVRGDVALGAVNVAQAPTAEVAGSRTGVVKLWWTLTRSLLLAPAMLVAGGLVLAWWWLGRVRHVAATDTVIS